MILTKIGRPRTIKGLATFCARIADSKLAERTVILDLSKIETAPTDFFVLCSCNSEVHVKAVVDEVLDTCSNLSMIKPKIEGLDSSEWVLLDFFNVVMHVMLEESRDYYKIEKLWGDAQFYEIDEAGKPKLLSFEDSSQYF